MNKKMVLIGIIISIIIIVGIFFLYLFIAFSYEDSSTIAVNSLDKKPDKYVSITSNQLNKWPLLKKAILSESYIEGFITNYFIEVQTDKARLFEDLIIFKMTFDRKISLFKEICKHEKIDKDIVNKIIDEASFVKNIRNKID